jgi:transcriptional regulator with XRE-family HTH domain
MSFRENLKAELTYSGMLVKELAAQTGLKKHTMDNYLSVRGRMPAADAAARIARALGVSVEYLVTGDETPSVNSEQIIENRGGGIKVPGTKVPGTFVPSYFSPEVRLMARIAEQLSPEYRKLALSLIESLRKHDLERPGGGK